MIIRGMIELERVQDITIIEVKKIERFAHLTDEEAQEIIDVIKIFSKCIYSIYERGKNGEIDLDSIINHLNNDQPYKNAA